MINKTRNIKPKFKKNYRNQKIKKIKKKYKGKQYKKKPRKQKI
jgi:hypothetical protein